VNRGVRVRAPPTRIRTTRRPQIVVRDARWHRLEVRERPDVAVEKADLILPLADPRKVATRVHQPHQEEPRLAADPVDVDKHLKEVDFGEIARPIRQRHEHLAPTFRAANGLLSERRAHRSAVVSIGSSAGGDH
jgi:hypothetical protein